MAKNDEQSACATLMGLPCMPALRSWYMPHPKGCHNRLSFEGEISLGESLNSLFCSSTFSHKEDVLLNSCWQRLSISIIKS